MKKLAFVCAAGMSMSSLAMAASIDVTCHEVEGYNYTDSQSIKEVVYQGMMNLDNTRSARVYSSNYNDMVYTLSVEYPETSCAAALPSAEPCQSQELAQDQSQGKAEQSQCSADQAQQGQAQGQSCAQDQAQDQAGQTSQTGQTAQAANFSPDKVYLYLNASGPFAGEQWYNPHRFRHNQSEKLKAGAPAKMLTVSYYANGKHVSVKCQASYNK